ncbi:protein FAR1-related sequence 6 [Tanacetum coccineum]
MVKILIEKDVKELPSHYILSRWRKDVKHRYNFITNCYDDLKSGEQVKQFDHLCSNFDEAANIVDSLEKYEYLMKCLDEAKEKLIDASSWGVNHVSNSNEEELLPSWKVRGRGRPPKRKKSTIEKLMEKQRNKNKKNASQGKKDKLPGKRGSSMSNLTDKINVDSVDMTNNTSDKHQAISVNKSRCNEGFDLNQSARRLDRTPSPLFPVLVKLDLDNSNYASWSRTIALKAELRSKKLGDSTIDAYFQNELSLLLIGVVDTK